MNERRTRNRQQARAGVTLIEMLVVVTIIGLFIALVGPRLWSNVDKAKAVKAKADIEGLMGALGTYKLDNGNFPTTEQGLAAHLLTVGEETGRLDQMFTRMADIYENDTRAAIRRFTSVFEPAVILVMGVVVGALILSMLLAITSINDVAV